MTPFDFVTAFHKGKDLSKELTDQEFRKNYVPFLINKALSYSISTVFYADELNMYPGMDRRMQHAYLNSSIRPGNKKYTPWAKPDKTDDVLLVSEYYGYNLEKARQALKILTEEEVQTIRNILSKGGQDNGGNKG